MRTWLQETVLAECLIDGHTHLQMDEFRPILPDIIEGMVKHNIKTVCNVGYDVTSSEALLSFTLDGIKTFAFAGIHPHYADRATDNDIKAIRTMLNSGAFNGIGEIGLDRYWHKDEMFIDKQKDLLRQQLKIAQDMQLPVMLHVRNAYDEALDIVTDYNLKTVEFHSFTGTQMQLEKIHSMNYFFGINGVITFKNSTLRHTLKEEYFDRMIIETDAPYLTPVPHRGKRNRSDYVYHIYDFIAQYYNADMDELVRTVYNNFMEFTGNEKP